MLTEVKAGEYTVRGVSVGGVYTSLYVPEIRALFDAGIALRSAVGARWLFLSHGHVDHVGALPSFLGLRALMGKRSPLTVFMPAEIVADLRSALDALGRLQRYDLGIDAIAMEPGDSVDLDGDLAVRAFRTYHPVPSLGYTLVRRIAKLRPQFAHLPGPEIGRRRKAGDDLFELTEVADITYATDTLVRVVDCEPDVRNAKLLIAECTFLDSRKSLAAAHAGCHIHLDELIERAAAFRNRAVVLMHFSQIYKPAEVHDLLAARCPEPLATRVHPFAPGDGHWPG